MGISDELLGPAVICGILVVALVAFAPRYMILLTWPIVFCYPQKALMGLLPLNAGLDDVYVLLVATRMLLPRGGRLPAEWAKPVVALAVGLLIMEAIGEFTGAQQDPNLKVKAIKASLKAGIFMLFTLALALDIRNERDVYRHLLGFTFAASLAYLLVLACFIYPSLAVHWEVYVEEAERWYEVTEAERRAFGPFNRAGSVGVAVCGTLPLAIGLLVHKPRRKPLTILALVMVVSGLGALLLAKSRLGMFGIAGMLAIMTLLSKQRKYAIALELAAIVVLVGVLSGTDVFAAAQERLRTHKVLYDLGTRARIWYGVIENPSPWIGLFGEGYHGLANRMGISAHNWYLDVLYAWGVGGLILFTLLIVFAIRWARYVSRYDPDPRCRAVAWGLLWALVASAFAAVATDPWDRHIYRMTIYFTMVVACLRYNVLRKQRAAAAAAEVQQQNRALLGAR